MGQIARIIAPIVIGALALLAGLAAAAPAVNIATYKGPVRATLILDGAKREGKVSIYSGMIENQALRPLGTVMATKRGFMLVPRRAQDVVVLARPVEEKHAAVLALLADGESWSSSALALALGTSARSVQRALETLATAGKAQWLGRGRARRWVTPPLPGLSTTLLLPVPIAETPGS